MSEIKISVVGNVAQQDTFAQVAQLIPSDVRRFHVGRQRLHIFVNQVEALLAGGFLAGCEHRLQAKAYSEDRNADWQSRRPAQP